MTTIVWVTLIFISWLAATISGIAGFGGSLIILPVFSILIGAKKAIPILTIAWMMGNFSRAALGYREIIWKPVIYFCLGALPAAVIGSRIFVELPTGLIMKGIAIFLFVIVVLRHAGVKLYLQEKWFIPWGVLVGFLSAVLGSAGPIGAVAFLGLNLTPTAYVASEAVTAVVMHLTKTAIYGRYSLLNLQDVIVGVVLGSAMVVGSWTARHLIKNMAKKLFGNFVDILLIVAGMLLFLGR